jgi:hypothetical protein
MTANVRDIEEFEQSLEFKSIEENDVYSGSGAESGEP